MSNSQKVDFGRQFSLLAQRFADREALVNIERGRRFTFRELHLLTNQICNMMSGRLELRRGDVYLSILENDNLSLIKNADSPPRRVEIVEQNKHGYAGSMFQIAGINHPR